MATSAISSATAAYPPEMNWTRLASLKSCNAILDYTTADEFDVPADTKEQL
jgi:hypothetical protein